MIEISSTWDTWDIGDISRGLHAVPTGRVVCVVRAVLGIYHVLVWGVVFFLLPDASKARCGVCHNLTFRTVSLKLMGERVQTTGNGLK